MPVSLSIQYMHTPVLISMNRLKQVPCRLILDISCCPGSNKDVLFNFQIFIPLVLPILSASLDLYFGCNFFSTIPHSIVLFLSGHIIIIVQCWKLDKDVNSREMW